MSPRASVHTLLRWLFAGRPGEEVRTRRVIASRGGETEILSIVEAVPSSVQPPSEDTTLVTAPTDHSHHAHDAGHAHHHHDPGPSATCGNDGSFDGPGSDH